MPSEAIRLECTHHAIHAMVELGISIKWVEQAVVSPALRTPDPNASEIERFFCKIPERDDRILRVAVNTHVTPWRVVSVFFDRAMRGKL